MNGIRLGSLGGAILLSVWRADAASVVNQGFNITGQNILQFLSGGDSSATPVPFYDPANSAINDDAGTELKPLTIIPPGLANNSYSIVFNSSAVFGLYNLISATLFVDAFDIGRGDTINVFVNGTLMGPLADVAPPATQVPLLAGGYTTMAGEDDNTIFDLSGQLSNLRNLTNFTIGFTRASGSAVLDGVNIQAEYLPSQATPEPAAFLLLGTGLATLGYLGGRRKVKLQALRRIAG